MQDKATDNVLVESPLEFLVSSVAFWLYGSAPAPSPQQGSVSEHEAIRVIKIPQVRPELPPAPAVRDNALYGLSTFESSTLSGFAMGVIFVIELLLLWKVIERGCGRFNAWRGRRKSENDRKAVVKNKEAETKTLSIDVDAFDRLESSNRHMDRDNAMATPCVHFFGANDVCVARAKTYVESNSSTRMKGIHWNRHMERDNAVATPCVHFSRANDVCVAQTKTYVKPFSSTRMKGIRSNLRSAFRKASVAGVPLRLTKETRFDLNGFTEMMGLYGEMCAIARTIQPATTSRSDVTESTVCWEWAAAGYDLSHNDKEPQTQLEIITC